MTTIAAESGPPRWRLRDADPTLIVVGSLALIAGGLFLMQLVVLALTSVTPNLPEDGEGLTLANFRYIFSSRIFVQTIANTLVLAVGSVAVMLLFAVPFAWLYTRTDLPRREVLIWLLTTKVAIPGFLVAMGFIFMMNPSNGVFNQWLKGLFGLADSPLNIYSMGWIIFLQGIGLAAPCFFMLVPSFMAVDSSLEEAARASGVPARSVFLRITLPLVAPAVVATTTYYFIIAMETFDYPAVLGLPSRTFVISTWMYQLISQATDLPLYGEAAALGVMISVIASGLSLVYFWVTRHADRFAVIAGKRRSPEPTRLGRRGRTIAWIFIGFYGLVGLVLPVLTLAWTSFLPYLRPPSAEAFASLSFAAYAEANRHMSSALVNSLIVMVTAPTLSVLFALSISWVSMRTSVPGRKLLDTLALMTVGIPSVVAALAFLYAGLSVYRFVPLFGSVWLIVIALGTLRTTWAKQTIGSAMLQLHRELEEAGSVSGVRRGRILLSIVIPIIRPALLFSWFWIALLTLRELTIPLMLYDSETKLMSTAIWLLNTSGKTAAASAIGMVLLAVIGVMVIVFHRIAGSRAF